MHSRRFTPFLACLRAARLSGVQACAVSKKPSPSLCPSHNESGFMLATTGVLILVIVAMLSTYVFVVQRDTRYQNHYAAGERLAHIASSAHLFAQRYFYDTLQADPDNPLAMYGDVLFDSEAETSLMTFPYHSTFDPVGGIRYDIEIRGWGESPINTQGTLSNAKAASAYMQIKIRPMADTPLMPSDLVAFMAGAHKRGLTQPGIVGRNIPSGDLCDGAPTITRWGADDAACLNAAHLSMLGFTDIQNGDIIVPTWPVSMNNAAKNALYRYKQPERPEMNAMLANLNMQGSNINQVEHLRSRGFHVRDEGETSIENIYVRSGHTTTMQKAATVHDRLDVAYDNPANPNAPAMHIHGAAIFTMTPADQFNVAGTIHAEAASPNVEVNVSSTTIAETIRNMNEDFLVLPLTDTTPIVPVVATRGMSSPVMSLSLTKNASQLAVLGTLDAQSGSTLTSPFIIDGESDPLNVYTANLSTSDSGPHSATLNLSGDPSLGPLFHAGALEQKGLGPNQYLRVNTLDIFDCAGFACPDSVTIPPEGGL